jgi:SAM-dependent methyltransferase
VREHLRETFNQAAELYNRFRPGYPPELFTDLPAGPRVLEIGCGTGQATAPVARLGRSVVAVELGADLAEVARRNVAGLDVEVVVAAFEDWPLPEQKFDLVLAATSFHWIDPEIRMDKTADALKLGGALGVVTTQHVAGGSDQFFIDMQDCYLRFDPDTPPGFRLPRAADVPAEFDESDRYGPVRFHRYERDVECTTEEYLGLLSTYSNHRVLPTLDGLLACIANLVDSRYDGRITMRYLTQLAVAERVR